MKKKKKEKRKNKEKRKKDRKWNEKKGDESRMASAYHGNELHTV